MILLLSQAQVFNEVNKHYINELLIKIRGSSLASNIHFKQALKELDGSFININKEHIKFHNPSIIDFLKSYILDNQCNIFSVSLEHINNLKDLSNFWGSENLFDLFDLFYPFDTFVGEGNILHFRNKILTNYPNFIKAVKRCISFNNSHLTKDKYDENLLLITSILKYRQDDELKEYAISLIQKIGENNSPLRSDLNLWLIMDNIESNKIFSMCEQKIFFDNILNYLKIRECLI